MHTVPPPAAAPSGRPRIAVVVGTRPEIIKLGVLAGILGEDAYLVHTGQHFDDNLSGSFLDTFGLPRPQVRLDCGGAGQGEQFTRIIEGLCPHFSRTRPAVVVVQGDTNTAAAAAQAAHFASVPVAHVEAGLRSYDRAMPEEINRILIGVLADLHCAPTRQAADNLLRAGTDPDSVHVTGNTVVEATLSCLPQGTEAKAVLDRHGVQPGRYILATLHRAENTDDADRLHAILTELAKLPLPVVLPAHPRTRAAARAHGLEADLDRLSPVPPLGYREFLALAQHARLLVSDSGGIQEECTVLKKPLIVVRTSTERPEAVEAGFAGLCEAGREIGEACERLLADPDLTARLDSTPSPYGDGHASRRIAALVRSFVRA